jgi:hypothetical protein
VLGTAGYSFPTGSSKVTNKVIYTNIHFDRRVGGWFYPLVEFNGAYHTTSVNLNVTDLLGFIDVDRHDVAGNLITVAPGFNDVIVHDRLEFGAVYQTPIYSQRHFNFNEVLIKMIVRF